MRAGGDGDAELKRVENLFRAVVAALLRHLRPADGRGPHARPVEGHVQLLRFRGDPHDPAVGPALVQPDLEEVLAVGGKVVLNRQSAARSPRQLFAEAASLIAIRRHEEGFGRRRSAHVPQRHLTDFRRCSDVALGQHRRQREGVGVVVESVGGSFKSLPFAHPFTFPSRPCGRITRAATWTKDSLSLRLERRR